MSKWALQSTDSGFHTCTVSDIGGCMGNATIEMKVVGEWLLGACDISAACSLPLYVCIICMCRMGLWTIYSVTQVI